MSFPETKSSPVLDEQVLTKTGFLDERWLVFLGEAKLTTSSDETQKKKSTAK